MDAIVLAPCSTWDDVLKQEYMKGEVASMKLLAVIPLTLIDHYKRELEKLDEA